MKPRLQPLRLAGLLFLGVLAACGGSPPPPPPSVPPPRPAAEPPVPAPGASLLVPVAGVHPHQLRDSYDAPRSGGRIHQAIDIPAPRGTPVLAVADGRILRLHVGPVGGNSIYQLDSDGRTRYYYAHLDSYLEGLTEGQQVFRGQVIGFVGDTGNAGPGNYHLHFSIALLEDPRRWWEGATLNPYPILRGLSLER